MNQRIRPLDSDVTELLKSARILEESGNYSQAYQLLKTCQEQLVPLVGLADNLQTTIRAALWRLSPLWWANVKHDSICLRRCNAKDADFFNRCFSDPQFSSQFNQRKPWRGSLTLALEKAGKLPPIQTGLLMWVIQSSIRGPIGLASFSSIDATNCRAELSIGFPGDLAPTIGIKCTLMMLHFALVIMPFNKVYAYIYEDNPQALHNALRLGFLQEGKLRDHFNIDGQRYVTVDAIGLTRAQMLGNEYLTYLSKRMIGQVWH